MKLVEGSPRMIASPDSDPVAGVVRWQPDHAYPGSARIGLLPDQPDPGWWLILALKRLGLAWNIRTPATMPLRPELARIKFDGAGCPVLRRMRLVFERRSNAVRAR